MDSDHRLHVTTSWHTRLTVPFDGPDHQLSAWLCLVFLLSLSRAGLFLFFALGISSANKLYLLLLSVFGSIIATVVSKALLLSEFYFPSMSMVFFQSFDIKSFSSLEYFFNLICPLKVQWIAMVFYHLDGLVLLTEATFTLSICALLLIYWMRKVTTASKSFSYLSALSVVASVNNLSQLMPFNSY